MSSSVSVPALLFALLAAGSLAQEPEPGTSVHLRVLATHDLHGALLPASYAWSAGRPRGGMAELDALMDSLQRDCACVTVRVDGGDQMQGTLESNLVAGESVVAAFNQLGLDAAAVGNHELDWSVATLLARQAEARYAWLAANVFVAANGTRPPWAQPYTLIEREGLRIGVIGYATIDTPDTLRPVVTAPYEFRSGYAGIREALDAVWEQEPDFVIIVAHAGGECDETGCSGELVELATELPPGSVHLIAGGHDHSPGEGVVNAIPIVRAGSSGTALAVVDLYRLASGTYAFHIDSRDVEADELVADADMQALIAPYIEAAEVLAAEPVVTLPETLSASATGDRRLGLMIAEALRRQAAADVGMQNPGGVRADLQAGVVTYRDVHRMLPFDNTVVRLAVTGLQLRQLVALAGERFYFANLQIGSAASAQLPVLSFADGRPVIDSETYTLGTNDFLADGGDGLVLLQALARDELGITLLDAMLSHLRGLP